MMKIKAMLQSALDVLLPRNCAVCGRPLDSDEPYVCRECMMKLPRTHLDKVDFNVMEQLFAGKTPIERATGFFYYEKGNNYASILHDIKYHNMPKMGQWIAAVAATEIKESGFFDGIDCIIPVPLHISKIAKRGYNQSDYIARGISSVTGAPVSHAIIAEKPHATQTHKGMFERQQNTQGLYYPSRHAERELAGKHVLIVDDVVTTGSTLLACAESIADIEGVKISLMTLAVARLE
jgi:ComF family protein